MNLDIIPAMYYICWKTTKAAKRILKASVNNDKCDNMEIQIKP